MSDEAIEGILMDTGKIVNRISAIASSAGSHLVNVRLRFQLTRRCKVIPNVLSRIITGNLLAPILTECSSTTSVRKHYHISLRSHQTIIPSVRP